MQRDGESIKINGRHVLAIDDGNAYLAAGLAGLGVLWLPDYVAKGHVAQGALVRLFGECSIDPMPLYIAYPQNRHVRKKLRDFIDWVVELMAQHAPLTGQPGSDAN